MPMSSTTPGQRRWAGNRWCWLPRTAGRLPRRWRLRRRRARWVPGGWSRSPGHPRARWPRRLTRYLPTAASTRSGSPSRCSTATWLMPCWRGRAIGHAIAQADPLLASIAAELAGEPIVYVLGAGPSEDVARCLAMCYLQEMQWRHAAAFNAGEFFHGAFEMITERMPVLLFMGEDETRPVAQRASRFLDRYTRRAFRVDSAELELPGVPAACRAEIGPIVLGALSYRLAQHYEAITGHSLENRRYMFKVDY